VADRVLTPSEMYAPEKWADMADGYLSGEVIHVVEGVTIERSLLFVLRDCARDLVRLRAERDLLRAEVRACRECHGDLSSLREPLKSARARVDESRCLEDKP